MNTPVEMINNTEEDINKFHSLGWGGCKYTISKEQIEELLSGKLIAIFDGEYTHVIELTDK